MKIGLFALLVAAVILPSGDVFTATNSVSAGEGGIGASAVSGYSASSVTFAPDPLNPMVLGAVAFRLDPVDAANVKVRLVSGGNSWVTCSVVAGLATCPVGVPIAAADMLEVVAHR